MRGRSLIGLLLVLFGGLLLLDQLGIVDDVFGTFWPLILLGLGLWGLATTGLGNGGALVLVALGVIFLGQELEVLPEDVWTVIWPLALVGAGLWLLLGRTRPGPGRGRSTDDELSIVAVMGGRNEHVTSTTWRGGDITAIMGGVEVHLDEAIPVEEGAAIEITAIMAGVELYVPTDWQVEIHGTPLLGGIDDRRSRSAPSVPGRRPLLRVDATAIMGGIEIKDQRSPRMDPGVTHA